MISVTLPNLSPTAQLKAKVEFYEDSTLVATCTCSDFLLKFQVERAGESGKFFGHCIAQKVNIQLLDLWRQLTITTKQYVKIAYVLDEETVVYPYPTFYVGDVVRDEDTNNITINAYDKIYLAEKMSLSDLGLPAEVQYALGTVWFACCNALGCLRATKFISMLDTVFTTAFPVGANFNGDENLREILKRIAEMTGTVFYVTAGSSQDKLVMHRLDKTENTVLTIGTQDYFALKTEATRTLGQICHVTELGDNIQTSLLAEGNEIQYIRDNPFFEGIQNKEGGSEELAEHLESYLLPAVGGTSITPFYCEWYGNFLLEPCDKVVIATENGNVYAYMLNQSVTYDGIYEEVIQWQYEQDEAESAANPTNLGEALNHTFAKVDKANKRIELVVQESTITQDRLNSIESKQTSIEQTSEEITLRVESIEDNGVTKVDTGTGFTFNEEGLRINKDNSGIENLIDNTGMYVKQDGTEVLSANEKGVKAKDLHAVTYLWIGSHSRFEDYEGNRTGCFWIS